MATMYETIMELPLFKGIGAERLSLMLEKTSVEFLNYSPGDIITQPDTPVRSLDFILKGEIHLTYQLNDWPIRVDEVRPAGCVVGALRLFGINTNYGCLCVARDSVSILRIGKENYLNILMSDRIYLLNYLNYLSAAAQRPMLKIIDSKGISVKSVLKNMAFTFCSPLATEIAISAERDTLARFCGVSREDFDTWLLGAKARNEIKLENNRILLKFDI